MYSNNSGILSDFKYSFRNGGILTKLIAFNIAIFLFMIVFSIIDKHFISGGKWFQTFYDLVAVPASFKKLITRFWTPLTYMFVHDTNGIFHLLFNMYALWWSGNKLLSFQRESRILPIYFIGGIAGFTGFLLFYNLSPALNAETSVMVGASASVMAILFATIAFSPDYPITLPFLGTVKLLYIGLFFFVIDLASISSGVNTGGHIAHIFGALAGYFTIKQLQSGVDFISPIEKLFASISNLFKPKSKLKVASKNSNFKKAVVKKAPPQNIQDEIDKILDKISEKGYESLTQKERELLFTYSKEK